MEDVDPDQLNFDGVAIEETMQNEGIKVVEDTDFLMDNPGDHVWNVNATTNSSVGGFFNVPNRMCEDDYLMMCRRLNMIELRIYLHTLHCFKTNKQLSMYLYIGGGAGVGKSTVIRALYEGLVGISIHYLVRTQMPLKYYWQILQAKQLITSMV